MIVSVNFDNRSLRLKLIKLVEVSNCEENKMFNNKFWLYQNNPAIFVLKETNLFSDKDGFPRKKFPEGWKGEQGLYVVGFSRRGLLGTSIEATRVAEDIAPQWNSNERCEFLK